MLQIQTVEPVCLALLRELMLSNQFVSFRLVGGTALSLWLGHRKSVDIDLFTSDKFDYQQLTESLNEVFAGRIVINSVSSHGVFCLIDNVKVDLVYRYEKFIDEFETVDLVRLSTLNDLCALKVHAAAGRNSKKDYFDIYELLNHYTFDHIIAQHTKMYPNYALFGTIKSLADLDDCDEGEDPVSLREITWEQVKQKIKDEVKTFVLNRKAIAKKADEERIDRIKELIKNKNKNK